MMIWWWLNDESNDEIDDLRTVRYIIGLDNPYDDENDINLMLCANMYVCNHFGWYVLIGKLFMN